MDSYTLKRIENLEAHVAALARLLIEKGMTTAEQHEAEVRRLKAQERRECGA